MKPIIKILGLLVGVMQCSGSNPSAKQPQPLKPEPVVAGTTQPVPNYPRVFLHNRSPYKGYVYVSYALCSSDSGTVGPDATWNGSYRGGCLLTNIFVNYWENEIFCNYESSGTGYSEFKVSLSGDRNCVIEHVP